MSALQKAIDAAGSQVELARRLGRRQSVISYWMVRRRGVVPAEMCDKIEAAVDGAVTRHDLRPDIFGAAPP